MLTFHGDVFVGDEFVQITVFVFEFDTHATVLDLGNEWYETQENLLEHSKNKKQKLLFYRPDEFIFISRMICFYRSLYTAIVASPCSVRRIIFVYGTKEHCFFCRRKNTQYALKSVRFFTFARQSFRRSAFEVIVGRVIT